MARVAVIVASLGRPAETGQLLARLDMQSLKPCCVVLSVESEADLPAVRGDARVVVGPRGLTAQRNRGLAAVQGEADIVVFYDDDFVPTRTALADVAALFDAHPDVAAATGLVLADGVKQGGVTHEEALAAVVWHEALPDRRPRIADTDAVYGCNMAFRTSAIAGLRFDEALPLYGWQEDVDFAGQILRGGRGRVVVTDAFAGVHRGVSKGRGSGVALGFSQIVNPVFLIRKGTMRPGKALVLMAKNLLANHVRVLAPEPFIDRRGRVRGNWCGVAHLLRGRNDPALIPRRTG